MEVGFRTDQMAGEELVVLKSETVDVGGENMYIRLVAAGSGITVSVCVRDSRRTVTVDRVEGCVEVRPGAPESPRRRGFTWPEPALQANLVDEPGRHLGPCAQAPHATN